MTMTSISSQTLGVAAASVTFSSIPGTYKSLMLVMNTRGDTAAATVPFTIQFNGVTTSYTYRYVHGTGSAAATSSGATGQAGNTSAASATASTFGTAYLMFPNYASSTLNKIVHCESTTETNGSAATMAAYSMLWSNTAAVTQIVVAPTAGNFAANSTLTLYGIV